MRIAEGSTDAIFAKGLDGRYLMRNRTAAEESPIKDGAGHGAVDDFTLFDSAEAAMLRAHDEQVIRENRTLTFEETLTTPRGRRTFSVTKGPLRDRRGAVIGVFGVSRDVTDRRQLETELRETREVFRQLAEIGADYFWETDAAHVLRSISPELAQRSGVDPASLVGKRVWELPLVGITTERWDQQRATVDAREAFQGLVGGIVNRSGQTRWFRLSGSPIFALRGEFLGYRGVTQDITEEHQAAQQLAKLSMAVEQSPMASSSPTSTDASST